LIPILIHHALVFLEYSVCVTADRKLRAQPVEIDPGITQIHSMEYKNPSQLQKGSVLIVGAGNSGSEIAMELAPHHAIFMSGRSTEEIPFRIQSRMARLLLVNLTLRLLFHRVLTVNTPIGRKIRPKVISRGGPLIRVKQRDMAAAGIKRVPRVTGVENGLPVLADGRVLEVANVIWCTSFQPGFSWIDLPGMDEINHRHERGVVPDQPGLYFTGLHFLYSLSSSMIHAVGRDAEYIARVIANSSVPRDVPDTNYGLVQPDRSIE
jgi:putative flavoprotein involved in K+ transport